MEILKFYCSKISRKFEKTRQRAQAQLNLAFASKLIYEKQRMVRGTEGCVLPLVAYPPQAF